MKQEITRIKEFEYSIFFIQKSICNELIQYNILTKKSYIHFKAKIIYNYYILYSNLIIHYQDWDYNKLLFWNNGIGNPKKYNLDTDMNYLNLILVGKDVYLVFDSILGYTKIYNFDGFVDTKTTYSFIISPDGKRIIYHIGVMKYVFLDIEDLNCTFSKHLPKSNQIMLSRIGRDMKWIYSNYLIEYINGNRYCIHNLNTNKKRIFRRFYDNKYVIDNYLLISLTYGYWLRIYDVTTLKLLAKIPNSLKIMGVNNLLNILITEDFRYFRVNTEYNLEQIKIGYNYVTDDDMVPHVIRIVMDLTLILIDLPIEILCIELYQEIFIFQ